MIAEEQNGYCHTFISGWVLGYNDDKSRHSLGTHILIHAGGRHL